MEPKKPDDFQKLSDLMGPYYAKPQQWQRRNLLIALFFGIAIGALVTLYIKLLSISAGYDYPGACQRFDVLAVRQSGTTLSSCPQAILSTFLRGFNFNSTVRTLSKKSFTKTGRGLPSRYARDKPKT